MRAFHRQAYTCVIVGLASVLSGRVLAQANSAASAEPVEEITVEGRMTLSQYRLEIERARDEVFRLYNEANRGTDNDITCRAEQPTGSRMRQQVCRSEAESRAQAAAARSFLNGLLRSAGNWNEAIGFIAPPPDTQVVADIDTGSAQGAGQTGEADALAAFEQEWRRLLGENRELYRAVVKYSDLQTEYDRARGATGAAADSALTVLLEEPIAPAEPAGPLCEATTLTEYQQRNDVARVTGTVSISSCPAGTTGKFTLVARVRDDAGEIRPIEFDETWQRADAQDHIFNSDYPIGDNVELMSVRVRGLSCTCAPAAR